MKDIQPEILTKKVILGLNSTFKKTEILDLLIKKNNKELKKIKTRLDFLKLKKASVKNKSNIQAWSTKLNLLASDQEQLIILKDRLNQKFQTLSKIILNQQEIRSLSLKIVENRKLQTVLRNGPPGNDGIKNLKKYRATELNLINLRFRLELEIERLRKDISPKKEPSNNLTRGKKTVSFKQDSAIDSSHSVQHTKNVKTHILIGDESEYSI